MARFFSTVSASDIERYRWAAVWGRIGLVALALALLIALPVLGDHWRLRYADPRYAAARDMIFAQTGRVQIVTLGTSRAMRAIVAPELARQLGKHLGVEPTIFDLSVAGSGMGLRYLMVRDLLARHDVDLVLIEYKAARHGNPHPDYFQLAGLADILQTPLDADGPWDRWGRRLRLVERKYGQVIGRLLTQADMIFAPLRQREAVTTDPSLPYFVTPEVIVGLLQLLEKDPPPAVNPGWPFGTPLATRQEAYMRALIELARRRGTQIAFYYVPALADAPVDPAFAQRFEAEFGAPLFLPDRRAHERLRPDGFADTSHLNPQGMRIYLEALATALVRRYGDQLSGGSS